MAFVQLGTMTSKRRLGALVPQLPPPGSTDGPTAQPAQPGVVPPPSIQPMVPQQPGTSFGPDSNLIGQQLTPGVSPDTQAARGYIGQNLGSLQQLPDRQALAGQTYDQLAQQSAPQFAQD